MPGPLHLLSDTTASLPQGRVPYVSHCLNHAAPHTKYILSHIKSCLSFKAHLNSATSQGFLCSNQKPSSPTSALFLHLSRDTYQRTPYINDLVMCMTPVPQLDSELQDQTFFIFVFPPESLSGSSLWFIQWSSSVH